MVLDSTTVVIPFRLGSSRFPRKALCRFRGRTLIEHALAHATSLCARRVVITGPAADLDQVGREVDLGAFDAQPLPSSGACRCATERVVELFPGLDGEYFLTLPVDEPAVDPAEIRRALTDRSALSEVGAVTFYCDFFAPGDYESPLSAKMVLDRERRLLYISRAVIPVGKDGSVVPGALKKNVGLFLFKRWFLEHLGARASVETSLDRQEGLEQLRWLELGLQVRCLKIHHIGFGIDVPAQVAALEERLG